MKEYNNSYDVLEHCVDFSDVGNRNKQRRALKTMRELMKIETIYQQIKNEIEYMNDRKYNGEVLHNGLEKIMELIRND